MDKIYPTREEVLAEYNAHQEKIKNLPKIDTTHCQEIQDFLNAHAEIKSQDEARVVLNYLNSLKGEWQEYYKIIDSYIYPNIYELIAISHRVLGEEREGINLLKECLDVIEHADEYKWLFKIKWRLYQLLSLLYFDLDDIVNARIALKDSIFYFLTHHNHTHYNNFDFYSFRPISDYLLDSLKNNYITVTDPQEFNDPVDPAILPHLDVLANLTEDKNDRELYLLQKEIYGQVRIRSLVRILPLPQKEGRDVNDIEEIERERNLTTMWAYYADFHKGICIKYVFPSSFTDHETNQDAVLMLGEVAYKPIYDPRKDTFDFKDAFFCKSKLWEYEHESRLVYFHRYKDKKFVPIALPDNCITEIYIGVRTSNEDKLKLKEAIKDKPGIKLYQMRVSSKNLFELEAVEIKREDICYPSRFSKINAWFKKFGNIFRTYVLQKK